MPVCNCANLCAGILGGGCNPDGSPTVPAVCSPLINACLGLGGTLDPPLPASFAEDGSSEGAPIPGSFSEATSIAISVALGAPSPLAFLSLPPLPQAFSGEFSQ